MNKIFFRIFLCSIFFLALPIFVEAAPAPILNFSDIVSGPKIGNTDGAGSLSSSDHGAIVTIWGNYLGSSQGSSKVYIGNVEVAHVYYWKNADGQLPGGPANLYTSHKMQEISFSIPASVPDGLNTIKVSVNGIDSTTLPFTVRSGNIYFIKSAGNDVTGSGSWENPWATLQTTFQGGNSKLTAGDIIYSVGVGTTSGLSVGKIATISGTAAAHIAVTSYPGSSVSISGNDNTSYTIYYYYANPYWDWSKFFIETANSALALSQDNRLVGLEITGPTVYSGYSGFVGGNCTSNESCGGGKYFGLYVHNYGTDTGATTAGNVGTEPPYPPSLKNTWDKFHHLYYISNRSGHAVPAYEIGWNRLENNPIAPGIHVYDQSPCGDWSGVMKIHNNYVKNQRGGAINIDLANCVPRLLVPIEIYNNILVTDPGVTFGGTGITITVPSRLESPVDQIKVYNNTVYGYISSNNFANNGPNQHYINNLMVDALNVDFFSLYGGYPSVSSNNLFYSSFGRAMPSWAGTGSLSSNPLFVDSNIYNFSLQSGSPAVGAGSDAVITTTTTDFYGQVRQSGSVDIGAIEYWELSGNSPNSPSGLTVL